MGLSSFSWRIPLKLVRQRAVQPQESQCYHDLGFGLWSSVFVSAALKLALLLAEDLATVQTAEKAD